MKTELQQRRAMLMGALIGAVLGAGTAYLLATTKPRPDDEQIKPLKASDLLSLTAAASVIIRKVNDIRHRL